MKSYAQRKAKDFPARLSAQAESCVLQQKQNRDFR